MVINGAWICGEIGTSISRLTTRGFNYNIDFNLGGI